MLKTVTQEQAKRAVAARYEFQCWFGAGRWQTVIGRVVLRLWAWWTKN
jgi:hypothetical protein